MMQPSGPLPAGKASEARGTVKGIPGCGFVGRVLWDLEAIPELVGDTTVLPVEWHRQDLCGCGGHT